MHEGELTARLAEHARRYGVPGAAAGVLHQGARLVATYGVADVRTGEPVTDRTRFSVGSLTKSMLATAVALEAGAGRLSLDDPVTAHVPELRAVPWAAATTLRDLMANRSRVPLTARLELGFAEHPDADDGALSRLVAEAAAEPADDAAVSVRPWSYSNLGWCLVGRALEVAVGRPWEEAMRTALAPVGLTATVFGRDTSARRATGHDVTPDGPTAVPAMDSRAYGPAGTHTTSTVDDLLRLAQRHLTDPALAPLREVHSSSAIPGWLDGWCLGWATFAWQGGTVWGWEGIVDGERAALRLLPREGAAFVVLTNASTGRAVHRALLADLGPAVVGHGPVPLDLVAHPGAAGDLSRYAGVYGWPDRTVGVEAHGDALLVTADDRRAEAWPVDQRTFVLDPPDADDPAMTFALDEHGEPQALYEQMWALPRR